MLTKDEDPVSCVGCDTVTLDDVFKDCSALIFRVKLSRSQRLRQYSPVKHREVLVH